MENCCKEIGYILFLIFSLLTYVIEIVFNCILAYYLFMNKEIIWFALLLCLICVPIISLQLVSYQQQISLTTNKRTWKTEVLIISVHILLLALPWRYIRLFLGHRISITSREIWQSFLLRTLHTFFSGIPILFLQTYRILSSMDSFVLSDYWYLILATSTTVLSIAWSLATYQKYNDYCCIIGIVPPWTASIIKIIWRIGEISSRILTLCLFASVHKFWVFLVLGFHWITMLLVLIVDNVLQSVQQTNDKDKKLLNYGQLLLKSYMYIFTPLNLSVKKSKYGFIFFYIICVLETIALLTLWMIYEKRSQYHVPFAVTVGGGYAVALIFALIYYNCFHRVNTKDHKLQKPTVCLHQCVECRSNHNSNDASGARPWLQISANPDPQFFDTLQSTESGSDKSSDAVDSLQRHELLILDPRVLNRETYNNSSKKSMKGNINNALEWGRFDMQIRETPEGASLKEIQIKESPRSSNRSLKGLAVHTKYQDEEKPETLDSPKGVQDQGYFSGISISSKEKKGKLKPIPDEIQTFPHKLRSTENEQLKINSTARKNTKNGKNDELLKHLKKNKYHGGLYQHSTSGVHSDTTTSSFSEASSTRPILNCNRCGHHVSLDAMSMYSATSTSATSMGSSIFTHKKQIIPLENHSKLTGLDRNRQAVLKRHTDRKDLNNKQCSHPSMELQVPRNTIHSKMYGYTNGGKMVSDATSSGWDYTDSEV